VHTRNPKPEDPPAYLVPQYMLERAEPPANTQGDLSEAGQAAGSLSVQVARAGSWAIPGRTVLLLANFGATPFTVRLLGPAAYGLWALIQAILTWAGPAEVGMGMATTKYGAERYALGDNSGEAKVVWSGLALSFVTSSLVATCLALGARPLLKVLDVPGNALSAGTWAMRVAAATFVVGQLIGVVNTSSLVRLRWKHYMLVYTSTNLLTATGVPAAIYLFGGGVLTAFTVALLAAALYLVGMAWDGARVQPALRRPCIDRATLKELVSYGGAFALAGAASIPLSTGERFFLSADASTKVLAYYAIAMTVATTLEILPQELKAPLLPALARLEATGDHDAHRALYGQSLAALYLVVTPAAIVVALLAKPFLTLWAGPAYGAHSTSLLLVALAGVWVSALAWVPNAQLLAAGKTKAFALLQGAELVPYLGAAWVLTAKWGALGAAAVWSARLAIDSVAQFALVKTTSPRLPVLPLSQRRYRSVLAPALLALGCWAIANLADGLLLRGALAGALLAAYGLGVWSLVLTASERQGVANILCEATGRRLQLAS